jgi:outer membrane protein, adhesin transport system
MILILDCLNKINRFILNISHELFLKIIAGLILIGFLLPGCSQNTLQIKNVSENIKNSVSVKINSIADSTSNLMKKSSDFVNKTIENTSDINDMDQMSKKLNIMLSDIPDNSNLSNDFLIDINDGIWESVRRSVINNESYKAALLLEDEAMNKIGVAKSVRRTQYSGDSTIGGIFESGSSNNENTIGITGNLNISKLIYDGGQNLADINQATAGALLMQATRRDLGNQLALDVASTWVNIWHLNERLDLINSGKKKMDILIEKMDRMSLSGMMDMSALDNSKTKLVDINLEKNTLQADYEASRIQFVRYFNQEPNNLKKPSFLISYDEAEAEAENWKSASILEQSVANVIIAQNGVLKAEAAYMPKASARAGINAPMKNGESVDKTIGVRLDYIFGDGGRRKSNLKSAKAKLASEEAKLKETSIKIKSELNSALVKLKALNNSMPLLREKINLTTENINTAQSQLNTGQATLGELVNAEISNFDTRNKFIQMRSELHNLLLTVATLSGALAKNIDL